MKNTFLLSVTLMLLFAAHAAFGQGKYDTYSNARFNYSIDYPSGLFTPHDESTNGDGRVFKAKKGTAKLLAWGQYNALFDTLKKAYASDLKERGGGVTYKALLNDGYVISGTKGGRIFYQKTILSGKDGDSGAVFATFLLEYPAAEKAVYDSVASRISRSFKFQ